MHYFDSGQIGTLSAHGKVPLSFAQEMWAPQPGMETCAGLLYSMDSRE
jgi:hypothetical protein